MEKLRTLFEEYYDELAKNVSWPKADELQDNTIVVLIASFIIAIVIAIIDFSFNGVLQALYSLVK